MSCQIFHRFHQLSTRMPREYVNSSMKMCLVMCGDVMFPTVLYIYSVLLSFCYHGMARLHVGNGRDSIQTWKVATIILNTQLWASGKGRSSGSVLGRGVNKFSP